jgi:hypothetical protein
LETVGKLDVLRGVDNVANAISKGILERSKEEWESEAQRCLASLGIETKKEWNEGWLGKFGWAEQRKFKLAEQKKQ